MNDTHGVEGEGWYGFDLDGTAAVYDKWQGIDHIGEPVKPIVDLIKRMHAKGKTVKILTARVAPRSNIETRPNPFADTDWATDLSLPDYVEKTLGDRPAEETILTRATLAHEIYHAGTWGAREFIADWCLKNLGFLPEITHEKDHLMLELYDDRVKQVVPNEGLLMEDIAVRETLKSLALEDSYMVRFGSFTNGVMLGCLVALVILVGVYMVGDLCHRTTPADKALDNPRSAIIEVQEALK